MFTSPIQHRQISQADPALLADMIDLEPGIRALWGPADLADILLHRLSAPVRFDPGAAADAQGMAGGVGLGCYGDLLCHAAPPLPLLEHLRDAAQSARDRDSDAPLPREVAGLLYFASVAAALVRRRRRIAAIDDGELLPGLRWAASQTWADESVRSLCASAADLVASGTVPVDDDEDAHADADIPQPEHSPPTPTSHPYARHDHEPIHAGPGRHGASTPR